MAISIPSRWLSFGLIGLGALLVISAISTPLILKAQTDSDSAPLPSQLGGFSLSSEATGSAALQEFAQLHGKSLQVHSGSRASYGLGNQVTLWIAGAVSSNDASHLLESMRDKIAAGNSPFHPTDSRQVGERMIYALDGMGQKHFYFQSGKYLIWLAAKPGIADQALQEVLDFYR